MSRDSSQEGMTLVEVMATIAVLAVLSGISGEAFSRAYRSNRLAQSYAEDLLGARAALDALERDLFAASRVAIAPAGDGIRIERHGGGAVEYRLAKGVVERLPAGQAAPQPLARNMERFSVTRDGSLVRASVLLGRRSEGSGRTPVIATAVAVAGLEGEDSKEGSGR